MQVTVKECAESFIPRQYNRRFEQYVCVIGYQHDTVLLESAQNKVMIKE